jgi:hypothetical protein
MPYVAGLVEVRSFLPFRDKAVKGWGSRHPRHPSIVHPRSPKQLLVSCLESSTGQSLFSAQNRDLATRSFVDGQAWDTRPALLFGST